MAFSTEAVFREDSYLRETEASVVGVNERGGIILDRTIFYATSGGQPGDTGVLIRDDGSQIAVAATITGESKDEIIHVPALEQAIPEVGERLKLAIDWPRRLLLMRMHAACHLLTVVCPYPITGASVNEEDSRVDFDIPDASPRRT
jgi:misacylated tRNA(Ala) deacylase